MPSEARCPLTGRKLCPKCNTAEGVHGGCVCGHLAAKGLEPMPSNRPKDVQGAISWFAGQETVPEVYKSNVIHGRSLCRYAQFLEANLRDSDIVLGEGWEKSVRKVQGEIDVDDTLHTQCLSLSAGNAELKDENERLRVALKDAIRRPLGVVPASAEEFCRESQL